MSDRPFKILGIQQIAMGGLDKDRLRTLWVDTLRKKTSMRTSRFLGRGPIVSRLT
jgi:hypothetical protein